MPIIKLTEKPNSISPRYTIEALWEMEILAHSLYPRLDAGDARKHWVEKIQRTFARDFTNQVSPLPIRGEFHRYWFALHGFSVTKDGVSGLKINESRDVNFAARILIFCALEGMSKAKAINRIAKDFCSDGTANSLDSAESTVKRAWKKYFTGCHYAAAFLILAGRRTTESSTDEEFQIHEGISLGEELRKIGETTVSYHSTIPILNSAKTWKVPKWYPLLSGRRHRLEG